MSFMGAIEERQIAPFPPHEEPVAVNAAASSPQTRDNRILLFLPTGSDAGIASSVLREAGFIADICRDRDEMYREIKRGAGVLLIAEEALTPPVQERLARILHEQAPWSDLPLLLLTGTGRGGVRVVLGDTPPQKAWDHLGNVTFLERPLRVTTLIQAVKASLRARSRQYDIREHLRERDQSAAERVALLERQRVFLRDVLFSVTEGKLCLCENASELPPSLPIAADPVPLTPQTLKRLRHRVLEEASALHFSVERQQDLITGVSEAAMNAVVHAGGGISRVASSPTGTVQVWVEDRGTGIDMDRLPRATLERGFSSTGTLGHGFWLILQSCDRLYLMTGPNGSTLVLEQQREPPQPDWLNGSGGAKNQVS